MSKSKINIIQEGIVRKPDHVSGIYSSFFLNPGCGVLYVTKGSPQYLSGHLRLLGRKNGQYPRKYKEMIDSLFGSSEGKHLIEVCSGTVAQGFDVCTVDINPEKNPAIVADGQDLPKNLYNQFDRWYCDPPYNTNTANRMYGTKLPSFSKLLTQGSKAVKSRGLLFLLLGNVNMQWTPKTISRIGLLFITIIPLQEVRALHVYYKH